MKNILLLGLISIQMNLTAQSFTIGSDKKLSPAPTDSKFNSIIFTVDKIFTGKKFEIYSGDGQTPASLYNAILGGTISKDENGNFTITIQQNRKIKECISFPSVPDDFSLRLDDKPLDGVFHLQSRSQDPANNSTFPKTDASKEYHPGYILYDALYLNSLPKDSNALVLKILKASYGVKDIPDINSNSFLKNVFPGMNEVQGSGNKLSPSSLISSLGGIDITNVADGFAKFIVKRTKQELSISFFEAFNKEINKYSDLKSLFPQTCRTLGAIGTNIYMFQAYIQTLRESFEKDLASLPSNLPQIIDNHKEFFNNLPDLKAELLSGFYISEEIQNKQHPGNIIENYPDYILDDLSPNIKASFQALQLFSKSLKNNSDIDSYWAPYSDIKKLFGNDERLLKIYLGLLEQIAKMNSIVFVSKDKKTIPFSKIIDTAYYDIANNLPKYKVFIKNISIKTQSIETKIKGVKKINNDSILFENYYSVVSSCLDLMKYSIEIETLPCFQENLGIRKKTERYFNIAQSSSDIAIDVNRRNYSSAIVNGMSLYAEVFNDSSINKTVSISYKPSKIGLTAKEEEAEKADLITQKKDSISKMMNSFFKYGSFMATVVQAKSSDDIEAAIESFALPSGSATIKRESEWNFSLNAYCGLFFGHESENMSFKHSTVFNVYGVTAPIGIAFSHSLSKHSSFSLFASIIDLGAITTFRFTNDSVQTVSKIQLKDVISPGLFASIGLPHCPVSINIGYQITPLLKTVNASNNILQPSTSRFSIGLCVDIPVLNFFTIPKE